MSKICDFLPMPRVIMVVFDDVQTLDVTGPAEVFADVARRADREHYRVVLASIGGGPRRMTSGITVASVDLRRLRPGANDLVIVAGGEEAAIRGALADRALRRWLQRASAVVPRIASVCSGAFVLAAAGVLDGKRAATHWSAADRFARMFPRVRLDRNAIFVEDGRVWSSAGVSTGIDMALAMVERDLGADIADRVAANLVLYVRRPGFQSQFSDALVAQRSSSDPLGQAISWARSHLDQADVESFARHAGLSVRTLHRRCLALLGTTPAKLLDKLRVERARALLTAPRRTAPLAKTVAASSGFGNSTRMQRAFERELGMAPRAYRALHAEPQRPGAPRASHKRRRADAYPRG
jgi:transcriptional regulator GlxA family with amidase domain